MNETEFFKHSLSQIEALYNELSANPGLELTGGFSLCGTPIQRRKPVIFGINWGGSEKNLRQSQMPNGDDIRNYRFIKQSAPYLKEFFDLETNQLDFNYTNLCFFRTQGIQTLKQEHFKLGLPIFRKYLEYIQPPYIISLGNSSINLLTEIEPGFSIMKKVSSGIHYGYYGKLYDLELYSAPHPSARLKKIDRSSIWNQLRGY